MGDVLPGARFSPAPGLIVDRTGDVVTITGSMEMYGPEASAARAATVQNTINTAWTRAFPDGRSVTCTINVRYRANGSLAGNATQIEVKNMSGPSNVAPGISGRSMTLNATGVDVFTWVAAHEFGHILGLDDRYSESIMSSIRGSFGGARVNTVHAGYEQNLMAVHGRGLESQNVGDLAAENEPSAYWMNDDDQVVDWVNARTSAEIGRLSTTDKLTMIRTVMGGWISDADVAAIAAICASVTSKTEADAIRNGVVLREMSSLGQRTTVRVAFAKMP